MRAAPRRRAARAHGGGRATLGRKVDSLSGSEKGQYFADLFAGTGGVGRAAANRYRVPSQIFDINQGIQFDLTDRKVLRKLERDALKGRIVGAMLATPCTSWSIARNRTNVIRRGPNRGASSSRSSR